MIHVEDHAAHLSDGKRNNNDNNYSTSRGDQDHRQYFFSFLYDLKRLRSTINRGAPLLSFVGRRKKKHTHTHTNVSHERHLNLMEK